MRRCWAAVALLFGLSGLAHGERIICIGDSITQGGARSQEYTYRLPLQSMLNADFIGTRRTGLDPAVKWPDGFDPDHEGYYGATSAQVRDHLKLTLPQLPPPDLALVYLGTNDGFGETVEPLESIIRQLRARNPQVRVFVGVAIHGWKSLYMEITLGWLARRLGVTLVRHTYGLADTFDGVHPNPSGQLKMAAAWFAAISRRDPNDKVEKSGS